MRSRIALLVAALASLGLCPAIGGSQAGAVTAAGDPPLGVCVHVRPVDPSHEYCVLVPRPL